MFIVLGRKSGTKISRKQGVVRGVRNLKNIFKSDSSFVFDATKFEALKDREEKADFLIKSLEKLQLFVKSKISVDKRDPNTPNYIAAFAETLSKNYIILFPNLIDKVWPTFPILTKELGCIPCSDALLPLYDYGFGQQIEKCTADPIVVASLITFFQNEPFCTVFLNSGKILAMFSALSLHKSEKYVRTYLEMLFTETFIITLTQTNVIEVFTGIINYVFTADMSVTIRCNFINFLAQFVLRVIKVADLTVKEIYHHTLFSQTNDFFATLEFDKFWGFYQVMLHFSDDDYNQHLNQFVLFELNQLYLNESLEEKAKCLIITNLVHEDEISFFRDPAYFKFSDWILPDLVAHSMLFNSYTRVLFDCMDETMILAAEPIRKICEQLVPPITNEHVCTDVFSWILASIEVIKVPPDILGDDYFIDIMFLRPSIQDLFDLIEAYPTLLKIIGAMISHKRMNNVPDSVLDRAIELISYGENHMDIIEEVCAAAFSPSIMIYLITRSNSEPILDTLYYILEKKTDEFLLLFKGCSCMRFISDSLAIPFLRLTRAMQSYQEDHFFDEWVLSQPCSSYIFQLKEIDDIIADKNIIYIPTLVPICNIDIINYNKSPYNMYLLGRYAMPVYKKLRYPPQEIPNLKFFFNHFIRFEDAEYLLKEDCVFTSALPKSTQFPNVCYEIFSFTDPAWVTIPQASHISFKVRFETWPEEYAPFINFGSLCFSIRGDELVLPSKTIIMSLKLSQWYNFELVNSKLQSTLQLVVDEKIVTVIKYFTSVDSYTIGSENEKPYYHIVLQKSEGMQPNGKVFSSFSHSFIDAYETKENMERLFYLYDHAEKQEEMSAYISLLCNVQVASKFDPKYFFLRYRFSLKLKSERCLYVYFAQLVHVLLQIDDIQLRTEIFTALILDFEIWSRIEHGVLKSFISLVNDALISPSDVIDIGYLIEKGFLRLGIILFWLYRDTEMAPPFFLLLMNVFNHTNAESLKLLPIYAFHASLWTIHPPSFEDLMLNFDVFTDVSKQMINFIFVIQKQKGFELLEDEDYLEIGIIASKSIAIQTLPYFYEQMDNDSYVQQNITKLCYIFRRFPTTDHVWNFLIDQPNRYVLLPLILGMIISISGEESENDFRENMYKKAMPILIAQNLHLLDKPIISHFINFLKEGNQDFSPIVCDLPNDLYKPQLQNVYPEFLAKLNDIVRINSKYMDDFLIDFAIEVIRNQRDHNKKAIAFLDHFSQHMLPNVFRTFLPKLISVFSVVPLSDALIHHLAMICTNSLFLDHGESEDTLFKTIFQFCIFDNQNRWNLFKQYFIFSLSSLSMESIHTLLEAFKICWPKIAFKSAQNTILFLYQFISREVPSSDPFMPIFYESVLSIPDPELQPYFKNYSSYQALIESEELPQIKLILAERFEDKKNRFLNKIPAKTLTYKTASSFAAFVFHRSIKKAKSYINTMDYFLSKLNGFLRNQEYYYTGIIHSSFTINGYGEPKSYRVSPFNSIEGCPSVILPSPFELKFGGETQEIMVDIPLFGFEKHPSFIAATSPAPSCLPLFRYAGYFEVSSQTLFNMFKSTCTNCISMDNCLMVRRNLRLKCIFVSFNGAFYLLANATLTQKDCMKLIDNDKSFLELLLLNDFGSYKLFCGHPIIEINKKHILQINRYTESGNPHSLLIHTISSGSFIISFDNENPFLSSATHISISTITKKWQNLELSTFDYLIIVNHIANRSFNDLSGYPIFPRIIKSYHGETYRDDMNEKRDLSVPLPVLCDRDPEHQTLHMRMEMQKYHHCENISNAMCVTSFLFRAAPFCNYQWTFHDGWDAAERIFVSIPVHFSISVSAFYEFIPELFFFPEALINLNNLDIPGCNLDLQIPKWSKNIYHFIDQHRNILEKPEIRDHVNKWIDLVFGIKQGGNEARNAINLYHPMAYSNYPYSPLRVEWIQNCGQLPKQIFNYNHPGFVEKESLNLSDLTYVLNDKSYEWPRYEVPYDQMIILDIHYHRKILIITLSVSRVVVYGTFEIASIILESPKFSRFCSKQLICATACLNNVVIWSVSTSMIINSIPLENVTSLVFGEESGKLYIASGSTLYMYTFNGNLIDKIKLDSPISAISLLLFDFTTDKSAILVGFEDGSVNILVYEIESGKLEVFSRMLLSHYPIKEFVVTSKSPDVKVFDTVGIY